MKFYKQFVAKKFCKQNVSKMFCRQMAPAKIGAIFIGLLLSFSTLTAQADLGALPVQDGGRIKPFDTFAREYLNLVWGKEKYNGRQAVPVVFSWFLIPETWDKTEFVLVRHSGLREALKLDSKKLQYSPEQLMLNDRLGLLIQDLRNKKDAQEKLDPFFQAVQTLENQLSTFHAIRTGLALRVAPRADGSTNWQNITELEGELKDKFAKVTEAYVKMASGESVENLDRSVEEFVAAVEAKHPDYSHEKTLRAELHYNHLHPFRWAWVIYLAALIFFSFTYFGTSKKWEPIAWTFVGLGSLFHVWGFLLRVYILGRAPVTNMFETVVWVAFVALIFAAVIYRYSKAIILPLAATMVAVLCLILCDVSSVVLDDSLTPLEPVLRDNFWLLTHVVIIVSSYAAFFLAFVIGDILLVYFLRDEKKFQTQIQQGVQAIYRSIQVGVVLLAAGTILGGVWADYSWGRFWGWDPKETWAFIALLGYLVILHGRLIGWLRNFGMAVSAVISFSLVIMAWYGVNFVLGAGLHTYGFGAGGVEYVAGFVALHFIFVVGVVTLRQARLKMGN
jgi:ABC-type transport system involved in cytochrome c biogenesis permease subunit